MIPVKVKGPRPFTLLAVWSKGGQVHPYVEGVVAGILQYRELIEAGPTLVVGDLNSNVIWDRTHPKNSNHSALIKLLAELGMSSCYHDHFGETQGEETRPTYYFHWNREKPFHIDYCFAPKEWNENSKHVEVGSYEDWHGYSDHRPLLVEFASNEA
jgi:exodeoxyribonuclease III